MTQAAHPLVLTATALVLALSAGAANAEPQLIDYEVEGSATTPIIDDDDQAFKARHGINDDTSGGIERLFMEWLTEGGNTATLEGRGMFNNHDYLLRFNYDDAERGKVNAGYRGFRSFYDGSGGYFPPSDTYIEAFNDGMHVDRGEAWFDGTLALDNLPEIHLKYSYWFREGKKPSTAWGDTDMTGGFGTRSIVNSFTSVDEKRNSIEIDVKHDIASNTIGAGFRYENPDISDRRNMARDPGDPDAERFVTQKDAVDTDLYNAHAFTEHRMLENRLVFTTAYAYTDVSSDTGGNRIYGDTIRASFDPAFANRQPFNSGFLDLDGDNDMSRHVGRFNVAITPHDDVRIRAVLRVEDESTDGSSDFTGTSVASDLTTSLTPTRIRSDIDELTTAQELELRYTGISRLVLYARGEVEQQDHDYKENESETVGGAVRLDRKTKRDLFGQEYTAGLNWHPVRGVSLAARYRYEDDNNDMNHRIDSTDNTSGNRFPAYVTSEDIVTHSAYGRLSWKPVSSVRLATRYDYRLTDYDTKEDGLSQKNSGEVETHTVGGDASWSPLATLYLNSTVNYVHSGTDTPASGLEGPATDLVRDFDNDYWTASVASGWAVSEHVDLEGRYFFYYSDNYKNNSATSQPYGSNIEEHGVTLAMLFHVSENLDWTARYGYFHSDDDESGGFNDYSAHFLAWSVQYTY